METLIISAISIFFSLVSLLLSIYNFCKELRHLKVEISKIDVTTDEYKNVLIVSCTIINNSKNNITINSINLLLNNEIYSSIENSIFLGYGDMQILNQEAKWENHSIQLPLKLSSYDSAVTSIVFPISKDTHIDNKIKVIFKTSRGKKKLSVSKKRYNNINNNSNTANC